MAQTATKPDFVPEGAVWDPGEYKWDLSQTNDRGEREGESLLYREDGRLYARRHFRAGILDGPFCVFHPSGAVAREGTYAGGVFDGSVIAYASETPSTERLRSCCVPENAWELRASYRAGELQEETFFDRQGRALLDDGTLRPDKPSHLDPAARFDESLHRWRLDGPADGDGKVRVRYWSTEGALLEDVEYVRGGSTFSRLYDAEGRVLQECGYTGSNQLDGPYRRRFATGDERPYADAHIGEERGAFECGQAVGRWTFLDEGEGVVRVVERGAAIADDLLAASPAFAEADLAPDTAARWWSLATKLVREGRVRESLCAAARAAACAGDVTGLNRWLAEHTVPLRADLREQRGQSLVASADVTPAGALNALMGGVDPAATLRTLAAVSTGASHAARDFIEAALLLDPSRRMTHLTRALIRIELGDDRGALDDAAWIEPEAKDAAEFVRTYVRVVFPELTFPPPLEDFGDLDEPLEVAPEQPVEEVRRVIQIYATRLLLVRNALRARRGAASRWMPPDTSHLLPDGPVALRCFDAVITDQTDQGPEETSVRIDEQIENDGRGVPSLLRAARNDWRALSWLCWSIGQDAMALPQALSPRSEFAAAASMSVARFWRANDRLTTGGLLARSQGVPGFTWEGLDIDTMPAQLAEIAAGEYLEVRAMFLWLASADNLSPFQSDLRGA